MERVIKPCPDCGSEKTVRGPGRDGVTRCLKCGHVDYNDRWDQVEGEKVKNSKQQIHLFFNIIREDTSRLQVHRSVDSLKDMDSEIKEICKEYPGLIIDPKTDITVIVGEQRCLDIRANGASETFTLSNTGCNCATKK